MKIRMKKGVNLINLSTEMRNALPKICKACTWINGKDYIVTITSGNDGKHMIKSKHYENQAIDIRINDMEINRHVGTTLRIRKELGKNYDVILEKTHIHIEYDPK